MIVAASVQSICGFNNSFVPSLSLGTMMIAANAGV
jgi:hypothetical protein